MEPDVMLGNVRECSITVSDSGRMDVTLDLVTRGGDTRRLVLSEVQGLKVQDPSIGWPITVQIVDHAAGGWESPSVEVKDSEEGSFYCLCREISGVDGWKPTFSGEAPPHWAALVQTSTGVVVTADVPLSDVDVDWLRQWFVAHDPSDYSPGEASYVYVGLADLWSTGHQSGHRSPSGVTGIGSGCGFGEPPEAVPSSIVEIVAAFTDENQRPWRATRTSGFRRSSLSAGRSGTW